MSSFLITCVAIILLLTGCSTGPEPIDFGKDQCAYCRMIISDPKYGGEMITNKGRIHKYDAIECMINHISNENFSNCKYFAVAYDKPEKLYPVDSLSFIVSETYRSPMGANLAAFLNPAEVGSGIDQFMHWEELKAKLSGTK